MYALTIIIIITILTIHYFKPLVQCNRLPRITITGSVGGRLMVYRTTKSRLVVEKQYKNCHEKWLQLNPNIEMHWFNDRDCRRFMRAQGKKLFDTYIALRPGAYKADLFRLCILYERGGVYVDAEAFPYVSLREMMKDTGSSFISVLDSHSNGIHNGLIISPKGHPFLRAGIERIVRTVERKSYEDCDLSITGPICLARAINEYIGRKPDTKFVAGLNKHAGHDLYLFVHKFGPSQYIYKATGKLLLAKKHCFFSYLWNLLQKSSYRIMYAQKQVYNNLKYC